jgi:hypothetical protein
MPEYDLTGLSVLVPMLRSSVAGSCGGNALTEAFVLAATSGVED